MKWAAFCCCAWAASDIVDHFGCWFRVFGWGLHVSTRTRDRALFSERYGYRRALYFAGLRFEVLKP